MFLAEKEKWQASECGILRAKRRKSLREKGGEQLTLPNAADGSLRWGLRIEHWI